MTSVIEFGETALAALGKYELALRLGDFDEALRTAGGVEQVLSDEMPNVPLSSWRKHVTQIAQAACVLDSVSSSVDCLSANIHELISTACKRCQTFLTVAEGITHFGLLPVDYFNSSLKLDINSAECLVIGIRTAGSIYAPPVAAALNCDYITIRPKAIHHKISPLDISLVASARSIIIVDEGPGTGATLKLAVDLIRTINSSAFLKILHHRPASVLSGKEQQMVLQSGAENLLHAAFHSWADQSKMAAVTNPTIKTESPILYKRSSLQHYTSPKKYFADGIVAKYVGLGGLGRNIADRWQQLQCFMPPLLHYENGVILQRYCHHRKAQFNLKHQEKLIDYCRTITLINDPVDCDMQQMLESFCDLLDSEAGYAHPDIESAINIIGQQAHKFSGISVPVASVDWKLERENWLLDEKNFFKLDAFHCQDYSNAPRFDPLVIFVGTLYEFEIPLHKQVHLIALAEKKFNRKMDTDYLHILQIVYLAWKTHHYYIASNLLVKWAVDAEFLTKRFKTYNFQLQLSLS